MALKSYSERGQEEIGLDMNVYHVWEFDVGPVSGSVYYGQRIDDDTGKPVRALHLIFGDGGETELAWLGKDRQLNDKTATRLVKDAYRAMVAAPHHTEAGAVNALEYEGWTVLRGRLGDGGLHGGKRRSAPQRPRKDAGARKPHQGAKRAARGKRRGHGAPVASKLGALVTDINRLVK